MLRFALADKDDRFICVLLKDMNSGTDDWIISKCSGAKLIEKTELDIMFKREPRSNASGLLAYLFAISSTALSSQSPSKSSTVP